MATQLIYKLNCFKHFKYNAQTNMILNQKSPIDPDIDEFLAISHLLDCNAVRYKMTTNFDIKIIKRR